MSKVILINTVCNGSTGKIMGDIAREYIKNEEEAICFYGRRKGYKDIPCKKFGNFFSFWLHVIIATIFDNQGHCSYFYTKKMIKEIKKENPDIIHLHNIHGYYLNYPLLFNFLKNEYKGKIFWTLHDCWPFTGHCPYFTLAKCDKWKTQCYKCPNKKKYPISLFKDNSYNNYKEKKELFTGLKDLTIIVPSDWLKKLVEKSFLKDYKTFIIPNGIDLDLFKPTIDKKIYKKYRIPDDKKIILGVANVWDERKGLKVFKELAKLINNDCIIVLVGLNDLQIRKLPKEIIGIKRLENQIDLVKLYSIASIFINPSKEETFSMVTLEALCCKVPVLVLENTPMCEFVQKSSGLVVDYIKIEDINNILYNWNILASYDYLKKYDKKSIYKDIINLYNE